MKASMKASGQIISKKAKGTITTVINKAIMRDLGKTIKCKDGDTTK